ncbi:hypothetical protein TNCT_90891 [Trichonephila clavata]|uniref:Uncharacterized protein n=1 Tax=Trichonephila clavata TaxID=2740835 RepID=A0A8X6GYG5_TRICU|nr:hypothetical protein TNCT_90891 [Trichonephila clavata]
MDKEDLDEENIEKWVQSLNLQLTFYYKGSSNPGKIENSQYNSKETESNVTPNGNLALIIEVKKRGHGDSD